MDAQDPPAGGHDITSRHPDTPRQKKNLSLGGKRIRGRDKGPGPGDGGGSGNRGGTGSQAGA